MKLHWRMALASALAGAVSVIVVIYAAWRITCNRVESAMGSYGYRPPSGVLAGLAEVTDLGWPFVAIALGGLCLSGALGWIAPPGRACARSGSSRSPPSGSPRPATSTTRIDVTGDDELGSLARSFNTMLDALERSAKAQKRLVADASHELRTPLTAVRTNAELLQRGKLPAGERAEVAAAVISGLEELTGLVSDIVELARDEEPQALVEPLRLDEIVSREISRASAHWPLTRYASELEPVVVQGVADRLSARGGQRAGQRGQIQPRRTRPWRSCCATAS